MGDDSIWAFVNGRIALDLGGIHSALNGTMYMDQLGLTINATYWFDFFYSERHTTASDMVLYTDVLLESCLTIDVCGVCNGDNSTCLGCDGKGSLYDACGVCAGNNACKQGCTGDSYIQHFNIVYIAYTW